MVMVKCRLIETLLIRALDEREGSHDVTMAVPAKKWQGADRPTQGVVCKARGS